MSGPHLVKKGREHRKMDLQRDFTVASPAEFVTRFGGNRVIEKVGISISILHFLNTVFPKHMLLISITGAHS